MNEVLGQTTLAVCIVEKARLFVGAVLDRAIKTHQILKF
jgi:hypothetical protein